MAEGLRGGSGIGIDDSEAARDALEHAGGEARILIDGVDMQMENKDGEIAEGNEREQSKGDKDSSSNGEHFGIIVGQMGKAR
jgi:hypothetical protein